MTDSQAKLAALRSAMRAYWRKQITCYRKQLNHSIALLESTKQVTILSATNESKHARATAIREIEERITVIKYAIDLATEQLVAFKV